MSGDGFPPHVMAALRDADARRDQLATEWAARAEDDDPREDVTIRIRRPDRVRVAGLDLDEHAAVVDELRGLEVTTARRAEQLGVDRVRELNPDELARAIEQWQHLARQVAPALEQLAAAVREWLHLVGEHLADAGLVPAPVDPEGSPMLAALDAKRRRTTGPPARPLDGRTGPPARPLDGRGRRR